MTCQCSLRCYLIGAMLAVLPGCASARGPMAHPIVVDRSLELHGSALALHLSPGVSGQRGTLVVYATGDAGCRNHSFGGARDALYAALHASLQWVQRVADLHPGVP